MSNIAVIKYENVVEIIDDCGGFDVSKIRKGRSDKNSKSHGIFLSTIIDPAVHKMFGFEVNLYNIGVGTRIIIKFNPLQK